MEQNATKLSNFFTKKNLGFWPKKRNLNMGGWGRRIFISDVIEGGDWLAHTAWQRGPIFFFSYFFYFLFAFKFKPSLKERKSTETFFWAGRAAEISSWIFFFVNWGSGWGRFNKTFHNCRGSNHSSQVLLQDDHHQSCKMFIIGVKETKNFYGVLETGFFPLKWQNRTKSPPHQKSGLSRKKISTQVSTFFFKSTWNDFCLFFVRRAFLDGIRKFSNLRGFVFVPPDGGFVVVVAIGGQKHLSSLMLTFSWFSVITILKICE